MEAETKEKGTFQPLQGHFLPRNPICVPNSLIRHAIVRRGITATSIKYDFDNKKEFLIDSAIFPGSSGSPVIIFNQGAYSHHNGIQFGNRLYLIGIVSKTFLHKIDGELKAIEVPSTSKIIAQSMMPNNLGIVIKSERILELIPEIRSLCQNLKDN